MKYFGIIILLCISASAVRAQDIDSVLHAINLLNAPPEMAVEIINHAMEQHPDSEELLKVRAEAYESLKQYSKSADDYTRLTQLNPKIDTLWLLLGRNQYKNGDMHDALKSLNRATGINRQNLPAYHLKIRILLALQQNESALKVSDSTLRIGEAAMSYFMQGEVYSQLKSWQKAEWAYDKATTINKNFIDAYIAKANITADANRARETLESAEAALGINPDSQEALIARSRGFALAKNYTDAIDDASYAITLNPQNAEALYWRGTWYREADKPQEALKDFEQTLKIQPDHWQATAARADVLAKTGNKNAALAGYRHLLNIAGKYPEKETITQLANRQIYELGREDRIPTLALTNPAPINFNIQVPDNLVQLTLEGEIADESNIQNLTINGQKIAVSTDSAHHAFEAAIPLAGTQEINIEITDAYNNIAHIAYQIVRTETGKPQIELFTPKPSTEGLITLASSEETLYVEGRVSDDSAIATIAIDGQPVDFEQDAAAALFSAVIDVSSKTRLQITATDRFGNTAELICTLEKVAAPTSGATVSSF